MRIGIFGGSFNPVHRGHIELAIKAQRTFAFDRLLFVPASCSPFKENSAPMEAAEHRLAMLTLAVQQQPALMVEEWELAQRGKVSYTFDTVCYLQQKYYKCTHFSLIIGLDQANLFDRWHRVGQLVKRVGVVVVRRRGIPAELPALLASAPLLDFDSPCSSSEIRRRLALGDQVAEYLTPEVQNYIALHRLYQR